jgi:ABC-type transport system substrate-binding protein
MRMFWSAMISLVLGLAVSAKAANPINSPYVGGQASENTLYSAFLGSSPRTVDPTVSFDSTSTQITYNTYEPLFRYHYLKRPYTMEALAAEALPQPVFLDAQGARLPDNAPGQQVAESVYDIKLRRGMLFAPHPAFALKPDGTQRYVPIDFSTLPRVDRPLDFPETGTREVTAHDYVYGIKRIASPRIGSPAMASVRRRIVGMNAFDAVLKQADATLSVAGPPADRWLDLRQYPLAGVKALDDFTLRVRVKGRDPQILYWMAMVFFAPIAWEADNFYAQPGMAERNLIWGRWPVGAGPYMLTDFSLNRGYTLERNPNYWGFPYPCEGGPGDRESGMLADCGKPTPFIDKLVFRHEKEAVPLEGKFEQGYYDSPMLDRSEYGRNLTLAMQDYSARARLYTERGLQLPEIIEQTSWYLSFNWLDPLLGQGDTPEQAERNRKLRQALSIALDWNEYLVIFTGGKGVVAHQPIPPGIFGYRPASESINPVVFDVVNGKPQQKSLDEAKRLLAEAGYPNGRNAETGAPLVISYDSMGGGGSSPAYDWMRRSLARVGVQLDLRATDFNRWQHKTETGAMQLFMWGWNADYPDAENFLTLFFGPNGKVKHKGENSANYSNPDYDALYRQMILLADSPEKQRLIDQMVDILRRDAPVMFGYNPAGAAAFQQWVGNIRPAVIIRNTTQFLKIDPDLRVQKIAEWNRPVLWPLAVLALLLALVLSMSWRTLRRAQRQTAFGTPAPQAQETCR